MMEHIYPAFERGRIMKKELLWALRDYSYAALQITGITRTVSSRGAGCARKGACCVSRRE